MICIRRVSISGSVDVIARLTWGVSKRLTGNVCTDPRGEELHFKRIGIPISKERGDFKLNGQHTVGKNPRTRQPNGWWLLHSERRNAQKFVHLEHAHTYAQADTIRILREYNSVAENGLQANQKIIEDQVLMIVEVLYVPPLPTTDPFSRQDSFRCERRNWWIGVFRRTVRTNIPFTTCSVELWLLSCYRAC